MEREVLQFETRENPWVLAQEQKREYEEHFAFYWMHKLEQVGEKNQQDSELLEMGVAYV